jgi:hypothetical protein
VKLKRYNVIKRIQVTLAVIFLVACATQARKDIVAQCTQDGFQLHPQIIKEKLVQRLKTVQVPTGEINCTTIGIEAYATTNCKANTRTEFIPYTALENIDINKSTRDSYILNCADSICNQNYKNKECK